MNAGQKNGWLKIIIGFYVLVAISLMVGGCITEIVAYQQRVLAIKIDERLIAVENCLYALDDYAALIYSGETENTASFYVGEALTQVQVVEEELADLIFQLFLMDVSNETAREAHDNLIEGLTLWKEATINYRKLFNLAHEYEIMEDYAAQLMTESDRVYIQNQMADNDRLAQDTYDDIIRQLNEGGNLMGLWSETVFNG